MSSLAVPSRPMSVQQYHRKFRATNCSPVRTCAKPNTHKTPFDHNAPATFAADSKRGLTNEWQHFAPVQVVLRALVRCAPILANQVSVDMITVVTNPISKKENTVVAEIFSPMLLSAEVRAAWSARPFVGDSPARGCSRRVPRVP